MSVKVKQVHHVGLTVSDFSRHKKLFEDVFSFKLFFEDVMTGPPTSCTGVKTDGIDFAFYSAGDPSVMIEICHFKESGSDSEGVVKRTSDVGCSHFAFVVEDIKGTIQKMQAVGVKLLSEPITMTEGPGKGTLVTWMRDWDGHSYELCQLPEGVTAL
ncbi:Glyoxalase/Bleomycin resistance protein/Dihydroxybiphenyl dioxygenase [Rhizodiscina lignyota]|uniref:Glyoxalase/Bleomycin resistance protein/Dihydroxybiphenyl dioxygenase n=1 Tax=Rhizodiscina lignyota TaxID=1504668 RepID=A0A9P4M0L2_9PEZI|nr:Glyoxalase/Bleomycin resistance protein/Dihydroxybiphenyl dioxygenase [Rhizodiscina lignyota]